MFDIKILNELKHKLKNFNQNPQKLGEKNIIIEAIMAQPLSMEDLYNISLNNFDKTNARSKLMKILVHAENCGLIAKYPNGMYGPVLKDN